MKKIRRVFTVTINDKEYDVYDLPKEHEGLNGEVKSWWLYYADRLPDGVIPSLDSQYWEPYHKSISRNNWEIKIKQKTTAKEKWGGTSFNNHTSIEMYCNNKLVYEFGTTGGQSGLAFAMAKIQYLQVQLSEHPFNFFNPHEEKGRKIYWRGLPATIELSTYRPWEIRIIPDYTVGLTKDQWWSELKRRESFLPAKNAEDMLFNDEDYQEMMRNDKINWGDALSDKYINWFRK